LLEAKIDNARAKGSGQKGDKKQKQKQQAKGAKGKKGKGGAKDKPWAWKAVPPKGQIGQSQGCGG